MYFLQVFKSNDIQRTNFIKELRSEYNEHLNDVIIYTNEVINFAAPVDFMIFSNDDDTTSEILQKFKNYVITFNKHQKDKKISN